MQEPKLVILGDSFEVVGVQTRTSNADEFDSKKMQIPRLWQQFSKTSLINHSQENDPYVYGVYSSYISDHEGEYILTAGINKKSLLSEDLEFEEVIVQAGSYLVFEAVGLRPESVMKAWQEIWQYFKGSVHPKRKYTTDFEKYVSSDKVEIYIAVEG
jgi:predicted transcriptional regulator YdeE